MKEVISLNYYDYWAIKTWKTKGSSINIFIHKIFRKIQICGYLTFEMRRWSHKSRKNINFKKCVQNAGYFMKKNYEIMQEKYMNYACFTVWVTTFNFYISFLEDMSFGCSKNIPENLSSLAKWLNCYVHTLKKIPCSKKSRGLLFSLARNLYNFIEAISRALNGLETLLHGIIINWKKKPIFICTRGVEEFSGMPTISTLLHFKEWLFFTKFKSKGILSISAKNTSPTFCLEQT